MTFVSYRKPKIDQIKWKSKERRKEKTSAFRRCTNLKTNAKSLILLLQSEKRKPHCCYKTKGFHFHMPRCCVIQYTHFSYVILMGLRTSMLATDYFIINPPKYDSLSFFILISLDICFKCLIS